MEVKREQVLGVVRHALTFVGGIMISKGLLDESTLAELSGSIVTLIGIVWSIIEKNKR